jgi:hypothetical protein
MALEAASSRDEIPPSRYNAINSETTAHLGSQLGSAEARKRRNKQFPEHKRYEDSNGYLFCGGENPLRL